MLTTLNQRRRNELIRKLDVAITSGAAQLSRTRKANNTRVLLHIQDIQTMLDLLTGCRNELQRGD